MMSEILVPGASSALQTLIAVSVLLAVILAFRKTVARYFGASVAYALWLIPLARLVLPPLSVPVSVMPFLRWPAGEAQAAHDTVRLSVSAHAPSAGSLSFITSPPAAPVPPPAPLPGTVTETVSTPALSWETISGMLLPALIIVWAGGALFCLGLSAWRHRVFMQTVKREAVPVSPRLERIAAGVGAQVGLKRLPVIASSLISSGPLVTGLARPVVLLPAWFENDYDEVQQRAALAHELSHVRRGDLWALQAAEVFVALLWFNPLAYAARRAFRTDQEAACDADVLKSGAASPHAYGATLIKAVRSASQERMPAAAGLPLTHALKERLSLMSHPAPSRSRRLLGGAAAVVLGAAALACTSSVTAHASEPEEVHGLTLTDGTAYYNGEKIRDRQIVILGDPFGPVDLSPEDHAEIARLSAEISKEGARIGKEAAKISARSAQFALTPEEQAELTAITAELADMPKIDASGLRFAFSSDMSDEDREALEAEWEEKWETWGEAFGEKMEAWGDKLGDRMDANADAWEAELEPQIEQISAEVEASIEAKSGELEALIESRFGDEFEARIEATTDALDDMVEECRDADLTEGETRIISRSLPEGRKVKIACVKGDKATLRSASVREAISSNPTLCRTEKKVFFDEVGKDSDLAGADD